MSTVWPAIRDICAFVQVGPWPSVSKVTLTLGLFCLNLSLIWAIEFLNASALEPEFQAMTLIVTGPPPPLAGGAAAAGAGFPASAGFDSPGFAGALGADGDGAD